MCGGIGDLATSDALVVAFLFTGAAFFKGAAVVKGAAVGAAAFTPTALAYREFASTSVKEMAPKMRAKTAVFYLIESIYKSNELL